MQSINLQIAPGSVNPVINVSQNDVGRQFQLKLYDGAAAYTLPTGTTASIEGIKPDGHAFSYSDAVSVSGSILTVTTKLQMTVVAGRVICEIRLRKSGLDLGSLNFVMLVEESPINENVDPSDTEIPAIIELAEGQVEDAEAWARGTKNGEPVPDTAPQYHNNAQWYAEHVAASLDALSNVNISSPANEDVLEYNSTTQKWKNSGAVRQLKQALSDEAEIRAKYTVHNLANIYAGKFMGYSALEPENKGVRITNYTAGVYSYGSLLIMLKKNTDYVVSCSATVTSGEAQIAIRGTKNGVGTIITTKTGTSYNFTFNSGDYDSYEILFYSVVGTSASGNVLYDNVLVYDAKDLYTGYLPFVPTNAELLSADANAELGAHNLFGIYDLAFIKTKNTIGTWNNNVYTYNGGTWTVNSDMSVTAGGTPTTGSSITLFGTLPAKVVKFKNPEATTNTRLGSLNLFNSAGTIVKSFDYGSVANGTVITEDLSSYTFSYIGLEIKRKDNNVAMSGTFNPLITLPSDPSTKFTPYAMTNRELTKKNAILTKTFTLSTTGSNNFSVRDQICCVKDNIHQVRLRLKATTTVSAGEINVGAVDDATVLQYGGIVCKQSGSKQVGNIVVAVNGTVYLYLNESISADTEIIINAICIL